MSEDISKFEQIKAIVGQAYQTLTTFLTGLKEVREERSQIINELIKEAEQKKISILKSKIDKL